MLILLFGMACSAQASWLNWVPVLPNSQTPFVAPEPVPSPTTSAYPDPAPWPELPVTTPRSRADEWNNRSDPSNFKRDYNRNFNALPLAGKLEGNHVPWSDSYWPSNRGGIAHRFNAVDPNDFKYASPTRDQALAMSEAQLSALSPAEKYDLYRGDYSYGTVRREWRKTGEQRKDWEGICNGWTSAALLYAEPEPITLTNPDGVGVPFGSSDVKGLLSFFYAYDAPRKGRQLGARCNLDLRKHPEAIATDNCADLNAGAMHIILANQLGLMHQGFAADVDPGVEIWNQPVFAFESKILGQTTDMPLNAASGTAQRVLIETKMTYADESDSRMYPLQGTPEFSFDSKTYRYWLDLSATGEILGGEWKSFERPDFFWMPNEIAFDGDLSQLSQIYKPAR